LFAAPLLDWNAPSGRKGSSRHRGRGLFPASGEHLSAILRFVDMIGAIREHLTKIGVLIAHPAAFIIVAAYALLWIVSSPSTFDWHALATLATWLMTLFIQRAEHRDTQAIQAKLDELLRANEKARSELTSIDEQEPEEIERHRGRAELRTG